METRRPRAAHRAVGDPSGDGDPGEAVFSWALGRRFVELRTSVPVEGAPGRIDHRPGRGRRRVHPALLRLARRAPVRDAVRRARVDTRAPRAGLSALDFHQRFEGTLSEDGSRIDGRWLISHDGGATFEVDFPLRFVRA